MPSWVRYSVAVYVGLLLAGSLMASKQASARPYGTARREVVRADAPRRTAAPPAADWRDREKMLPEEKLNLAPRQALPLSHRERFS